MISVSFSTADEAVRVKAIGHANTAPFGQDIVCAAVSALVCTFAAVLREAEESEKLLSLEVYLQSGEAEIFC